ncbi:DUF364 domain-containing protein [Solwaraspora sp. WMMD1047]|uniref:Rossmann-like domain-containing protein n=1 Tax=Solwaraspora sp. WMMD1047 TaxID=3016102 RepID=UPI0024173CAE|nr:DUF364 domain-containing protein [Solwaraspora sp. WMMD1047]MDG4831738.1 DUF364 domain-containing protein [Solwaraspora sp. WMMD1047]
MTAPTPTRTGTPYTSVAALIEAVGAARFGPDPATEQVSVAFTTRQGARHAGRVQGYRNQVLSLRVGTAVGSCAAEPGELTDDVAYDCVGRSVAELLAHPLTAVRVAALDAYLAAVRPHPHAADETVVIPAGTSLAKSTARAAAVVELIPVTPGQTVLVVGVVNSLLEQLRRRGASYLPCDLAGGRTEWDEPCLPDATVLLERCDALLVSGMTLGNGTFEPLLRHARLTGKPMVTFAQTGSAVLPCFLGAGLSAVSAEPYPFFWLDGGPTTVYRYRVTAGSPC